MFYLRREREEREAGRSEEAALAAAAATSGRAVMISGLTVMVAMAGMYLAGASTFQSFATGTILVVAVAVARLADRAAGDCSPGSGTGSRRAACRSSRTSPWNAGEPRPVVADPDPGPPPSRRLGRWPPAGLLVVLAIPAFSLHTANPGVETLPQDLSVIQTYDRMQDAFPAGRSRRSSPSAPTTSRHPPCKAAIVELRDTGRCEPALRAADHGRRQLRPHRRAGQHPAGRRREPTRTSTAALAALRGHDHPGDDRRGPGCHGRRGRLHRRVEGLHGHDEVTRCRWCSASCCWRAFLLLLFTFRSIVIPVTAILLNLLSVGAAYGILVWIFQDGHLESVARLRVDRGDRVLDADLPVRGAVRPLDGLPRVHPDAASARPSTAGCRATRPSRTGSRRRPAS